MRHIFLVNPSAGQRSQTKGLEAKIQKAAERADVSAEIYETKGGGDAEAYVKTACETKDSEETVRFYACGGDGALNEIVNGAFGYDNVEVGCIPLGTGNDYIRNYGSVEDFLDLNAQLKGEAVYSDLIMCTEQIDGEKRVRYCANMLNIGFDCNVVDQTDRVKRWPLIRGSLAYLLSVAIVLIKKKGADLRVEYEGGSIYDGRMLLIAIANGSYCGGGLKGSPRALLNDGLMDISIIKDMSRITLINLFPKYAKGTHLEEKHIEEVVDYRTCKSLTITPNEHHMRLCTDGEITSAGKTQFNVVSEAIRFVIPSKG